MISSSFRNLYHIRSKMAERYPTNKRFPEVWKEIQETNAWIRESQMARAYAFPHAYAPEGRLREVEPLNYMMLMNQHYIFRTSQQDLTLELQEVNEDGEVAIRTKVGQAFSADFQWDEFETNLRNTFAGLRRGEDFFDVTLVTGDGKQIKAHKIVLSSSSNFFRFCSSLT